MTLRNILSVTLLLASATLMQATATPDQILGTWSADGGKESKIEITKCGNTYCGAIIWMRLPRNDDKNSDAGQRNRPLVGAKIMNNFKFEGGAWVGKLYDHNNGKTFESKFMLLNKNELEIREGEGKKLAAWKRVVE